MKKKNCLFLLLLSAGLATHAQSGWLVATPLPDDIKYTIIRQYQDDQSVIYISTATDCYFAWSDNQTMVNLISIDCGYVVNDFEIYGDTVCFCGQYNGTLSYGLVGWFCIPDLLASTDGFHLYYYQFETAAYGAGGSTSFVVNFNDLTIFKGEDPGLLHVALVGETKDNESCVVELKGVFQTNTWTYTSGTSHPHAGTLTQVVETDNYIAVGGIGLSIDQVSTLHRAFYKNNMFASPCLGDWLYRYTGGQYPTCSYPVDSLITETVKANFGRKDHDEYPLGIYSDSFDFFDAAPAEKLTFQLDFRCIEQ